jgi:hypothetical protein
MNRRGNACLSVDERVSGRGTAVGTADVAAEVEGGNDRLLLALTVRTMPAKATMTMVLTRRRRHI